MYFRAGVMMPPMFSTNAVLVSATGLPKLADPGAAFTNQLISSLNGSTLECRMDTPLGTNNDLQFNPVLVHVDPVSQVLSVPYNGGFQSVGVVLTNVPGDRSALVVRFTTDAPTYVVGLVLGGVELLARPNPLNAPTCRKSRRVIPSHRWTGFSASSWIMGDSFAGSYCS